MGKHGIGAMGLVAACMALSAPAASAGDAAARVYTFQVEVDRSGALTSVQPAGGAGDATTTAQLQRELATWVFERNGGSASGSVSTWVRVTALPAAGGSAARILSASVGPAPDALNLPDYPDNARRLGHEGVVVLELAVDADGAVQKASVHQTAGRINRAMANAALAAARGWSFRPERIDGAPQAGTLLMPVCFSVSAVPACQWTGPNDQALGRDAVVALAPTGRLTSPASYAAN